MCLAQADHRPAHLTRVHQALTSLPEDDQRRLGVHRGLEARPAPAHLPADRADLRPGRRRPRQGRARRAAVAGAAGASAMTCWRHPSRRSSRTPAPRWRWTGRTWSPSPGPRRARGGDCADPEASWGHRKNNLLRSQDELFYGYYLSAGIMMPEENGPAVPELARRATVSSCRHDPVRAFAPVLTAMPAPGSRSATSSTTPATPTATPDAWALPLRAAGAQLVQDLHPHDRGPKGTHHGAIIANGNLYCPCTPRPLLELGPLARTATREQAADHDRQTAELRPLQARPPHPRRRRRLPPRRSAPPPWARSAARSAPPR